MEEQKQQEAYRTSKRTERFVRVTLELPEDDWNYITEKSRHNRSEWVRRAIKREREREEQQS